MRPWTRDLLRPSEPPVLQPTCKIKHAKKLSQHDRKNEVLGHGLNSILTPPPWLIVNQTDLMKILLSDKYSIIESKKRLRTTSIDVIARSFSGVKVWEWVDA